MGDDITIDAGVANELTASLTNVDLSGAAAMPPLGTINIGGTVAGTSLGTSLLGTFNSLNEVITNKANNLTEIAQIMIQADADLAAGI